MGVNWKRVREIGEGVTTVLASALVPWGPWSMLEPEIRNVHVLEVAIASFAAANITLNRWFAANPFKNGTHPPPNPPTTPVP